MRVLARSLTPALAVTAVPLGVASAHECVVANRSDTANQHVLFAAVEND